MSDEHTFLLQVVTPNRTVLSEKVSSVTLPSVTGELTILPDHDSLFTPTTEGQVKIRKGSEESYLSVGKGILEVHKNNVSLLTEDAYYSEEINEEKVSEAQKAAEKILKEKPAGTDTVTARAIFRRSLIDLKVAKKKKSRHVS